jgi:hypothetical protein
MTLILRVSASFVTAATTLARAIEVAVPFENVLDSVTDRARLCGHKNRAGTTMPRRIIDAE